MFRAAFRGTSNPLGGHVCLVCLAHRSAAPATFRQFHRAPVLQSETNSVSPAADKPPPDVSNTANIPSQKNSQPELNPANTASATPSSNTHATSKDQSNETKKSSRRRKKAAKGDEKKKTKKAKKVTKDDSTKKAKPKPSVSGSGLQKVTELLEKRKKADQGANDQSVVLGSHFKGITTNRENSSVGSRDQELTALDLPEFPTAPVPGLAHGLDRALFNPGVYHLRDPRSRVYNFDPYLGSIMPVDEFDFDLLKEYITSSKDDTLKNLAVHVDKKYRGSSSSMTAVLAHFHFLLSGWRPVDTRMLSQGFQENLRSFAKFLRAPAAVFLHYKDGKYAVDADKEYDSGNILMELGKSMEKLLTMPKEEFERYRRSHQNKMSAEEEEAMPESYHYSTIGNFAMRSQLDAWDPRLPGTGMFDLKTRAVSSIRADARNFENGLGYEIRSQFGLFESYEREYYDMIRAAFLKYSLQVRIGRMNGIFVAHHNIERIFGFQYISLSEMDLALHGQADTNLGDREFQISMDLWGKIMDRATARFPKRTLRFHFETRTGKPDFMYIFAEPVTEEQISVIHMKSKIELETYRQRILNITPNKFSQSSQSSADTQADSQTSEPDEAGSGKTKPERTTGDEPQVMGMILTTQNLVNGMLVDRPTLLRAKDEWNVDYELCDMLDEHARQLYRECRERRRRDLDKGETDGIAANDFFKSRLRAISKKGQEFRKIQNMLDEKEGITVYDPKA